MQERLFRYCILRRAALSWLGNGIVSARRKANRKDFADCNGYPGICAGALAVFEEEMKADAFAGQIQAAVCVAVYNKLKLTAVGKRGMSGAGQVRCANCVTSDHS